MNNDLFNTLGDIARPRVVNAEPSPTAGDLDAMIRRLVNAPDVDAVRAEVPALLEALAALPVMRRDVLAIAMSAAFGAGRCSR